MDQMAVHHTHLKILLSRSLLMGLECPLEFGGMSAGRTTAANEPKQRAEGRAAL